MRAWNLIALTSLLLPIAAAQADTTPPPAPAAPPTITLVRGSISEFDGKMLTVKTDAGSTSAAFPAQTRVSAVEKRTFDQLKPTDFVGITSSPGKNGHLAAEEIHIIPLAGLGEGTYPWDHHPAGHSAKRAGSMTNGTIAPQKKTAGSMTNGTLAKGDSAWQLKVSYRGSELVDGKCVGHAPTTPTGGCTGMSIVDVSPTTAIAAIVPAKPEDLKAGSQVVGSLATMADGKSFWVYVTTEKDGVKPEF